MAVLSGSRPGPSLAGGSITDVRRLCFSKVRWLFPPRSRDGRCEPQQGILNQLSQPWVGPRMFQLSDVAWFGPQNP